VNYHFGSELFPGDADVRFLYDQVNRIKHVDQDEKENLDHRVLVGRDYEHRNQQFVPQVYQGSADFSWTHPRFQVKGKNAQFVDSGFGGVGQVDFVLVMDKVVFGVENQNNFLESDEIVGLLEHQVGRGGLLAQTSQFEDEVPGYYKEPYDEQPRTEDGETLDGSFHSEILHADQSHQENWEEQNVDQAKEVLLPESFPDEPLAPVLDSLVKEFLAENKSYQNKY
jgi:hypothetical protein